MIRAAAPGKENVPEPQNLFAGQQNSAMPVRQQILAMPAAQQSPASHGQPKAARWLLYAFGSAVFATGGSWLVFKERLTKKSAVGLVMIVGGTLLLLL